MLTGLCRVDPYRSNHNNQLYENTRSNRLKRSGSKIDCRKCCTKMTQSLNKVQAENPWSDPGCTDEMRQAIRNTGETNDFVHFCIFPDNQ